MYNELLDKDVQQELEQDLIINWSQELTCSLGSRLNALWNRSDIIDITVTTDKVTVVVFVSGLPAIVSWTLFCRQLGVFLTGTTHSGELCQTAWLRLAMCECLFWLSVAQ